MFVEIVNLIILQTNKTTLDVIMNFLALVIISEFDDYFFKTVAKEMLGDLLTEKEMPIYNYDEGDDYVKNTSLSLVLSFKRTSSK